MPRSTTCTAGTERSEPPPPLLEAASAAALARGVGAAPWTASARRRVGAASVDRKCNAVLSGRGTSGAGSPPHALWWPNSVLAEQNRDGRVTDATIVANCVLARVT